MFIYFVYKLANYGYLLILIIKIFDCDKFGLIYTTIFNYFEHIKKIKTSRRTFKKVHYSFTFIIKTCTTFYLLIFTVLIVKT